MTPQVLVDVFDTFNKLGIILMSDLLKYERLRTYEFGGDSHECNSSNNDSHTNPLVHFRFFVPKLLFLFPNRSRRIGSGLESITFTRRVVKINARANIPYESN